MATEIAVVESIELLRENHSIKRIWFVAFATALLSVIPVMLLNQRAPWVISIPIIIGTLAAILPEIWNDFRPFIAGRLYGQIFGPASGVPSDLSGLKAYSTFLLQVPQSKESQEQELFSFLSSASPPIRKHRKVMLDTGEEIYLVGTDRFIELLVDRLLKDSDAIVEHAITMAATRFGGAGHVSKVILQAIQSDFRGNWITVVSRDAELVLRQLEQKLRAEQLELGELGTSEKSSIHKRQDDLVVEVHNVEGVHIIPSGSGWNVSTKDGSTRSYSRQQDALSAAIKIAKGNQIPEIVMYDRDGKVVHTYSGESLLKKGKEK